MSSTTRERRRIKTELRSLRITRAGLWLTPVVGWLFLPGNGRKIEALRLRLILIESHNP